MVDHSSATTVRSISASAFTATGIWSLTTKDKVAGKFYRYQDGLDPSAAAFLKQLKQLVDPQGRMNPGGLGL